MILSPNAIQRVRQAFSFLFIPLGVWIAFITPPDGLSPQTMKALGITVWAVGWWITQIVPEYVTGLLMCVFWAATKCVPFQTAFATFSTSGWWIMVGAFALGAVAGKTGLLKRISLCVLHLFPASFAGQVWGLIASGTVISPLIPSINAKATLSTPIALNISDELDMERKKAGACGLFGACYVGFVLAGHMFMSGSFTHYVLVGMLPPEYRGVTWLDWLLWSLPWGLVMLVGMGLYIIWAYKPSKSVRLTKDNVAEQIRNLGPLSREERITLWTLIITLLLWMTEAWHGISSGEVAVTAMCVLLMSKVMDRKDFKNGHRLAFGGLCWEYPQSRRRNTGPARRQVARRCAEALPPERRGQPGFAHRCDHPGHVRHPPAERLHFVGRRHFRAHPSAVAHPAGHEPVDRLHGRVCRRRYLVSQVHERILPVRRPRY